MRAVIRQQVQLQMELGSGDKLALVVEGLDHLSIGFTVFDRQLVLVACNQRFQEMLNFPMNLVSAWRHVGRGLALQRAQRRIRPRRY